MNAGKDCSEMSNIVADGFIFEFLRKELKLNTMENTRGDPELRRLLL